MKSINSRFENSDVELDGNEFDRCELVGCRLNYRGGEFPKISNSIITGCSFILLDAAQRTIEFLRALHASGDTGPVNDYVAIIMGKKPSPPASAFIQ
jgi:hypothetical protein